MTPCFCTLAFHQPYRRRARLLCADLPSVPWVVFTDEPDDFSDLAVRAVRHVPTGPMAPDIIKAGLRIGGLLGEPAYHDRRFAIQAALEESDTAIFVDADTRIATLPPFPVFPPGIAVLRNVVHNTIAGHLEVVGSWRKPIFTEFAKDLMGDEDALQRARWCQEAFIAVTRDGHESRFFEAWSRGADYFQSRDVYTGEGGVIGLAALYAGWTVDYESLTALGAAIRHEGGGIKTEGPKTTNP
jgi:hypothetical protein